MLKFSILGSKTCIAYSAGIPTQAGKLKFVLCPNGNTLPLNPYLSIFYYGTIGQIIKHNFCFIIWPIVKSNPKFTTNFIKILLLKKKMLVSRSPHLFFHPPYNPSACYDRYSIVEHSTMLLMVRC